MFQKCKHGNLSFMMIICISITLASCVMLTILSESYSRDKVLIKSYNTDLVNSSINEVIGSSLIGIIDQRELESGQPILTLEDLNTLKSTLSTTLGTQSTQGTPSTQSNQITNIQIEADVQPIDTTDTVKIRLNNGYNIELSNIQKDQWQVEEIVGYNDEDGTPVIEYTTMYRINATKAKVGIWRADKLVDSLDTEGQ